MPYIPLIFFPTTCRHHRSLSCYFHRFPPSLLPPLVTECDSEHVDSQPEGQACRLALWGINHLSRDQYQRAVSWTGY